MDLKFVSATTFDIKDILSMMNEFYIHEKLDYDESKLGDVLKQFLNDEKHGKIWLINFGSETIGYAVLSFVFSLEFGGLNALLDEFYIKEEFRGKGAGSKTLGFLENECKKAGVSAIHLQVLKFNIEAEKLYSKKGFENVDRLFMTKIIKNPEDEK